MRSATCQVEKSSRQRNGLMLPRVILQLKGRLLSCWLLHYAGARSLYVAVTTTAHNVADNEANYARAGMRDCRRPPARDEAAASRQV